MNTTSIRFGSFALAGSFAALAMAGGAMPASAATADAGQCVTTPSSTKLVNHDALWRTDTTTVTGKDAIKHAEQRWSREVPAVKEVSFNAVKYEREIPGNEEISYERWLNKYFSAGNKEESHREYRFSHENQGREATFKQEQQFTRTASGPDKTHQAFKYQQSEQQFRFRNRVERPDNTVERKFIKGYDFVAGGTTRVGNQTVAGHWVQSAGWHAIPDSIINVVWGTGGVPPQYLGGNEANPKGNVNLTTYGGPNVNSPYYASLVTIDGGFTDWGPWSNWTTTNPGGDTATRDTDTQTITTPYKGGEWTTDTPGAPWVKVDEKTVTEPGTGAPITQYLKADGTPTTNPAEAGWFKEASFAGWTQFGASKSVPDLSYIAPFTEYLKADGTATPNEGEAGWFKESAIAGWNQFGASKKVVTVEFKASQTFYLTKDAQGNLGQTEDKSKASFFSDKDAAVDPKWVKIDIEKVIEEGDEATPDRTVYLTQDAQGVFGESEEAEDADWIKSDTVVDLAIWQQMVDEHGDPLTKKFTSVHAVKAYTEYYVTGGEPTRELGESNWTKDKPVGWSFVDLREKEYVKAVPPTVVSVEVPVKAAWTETVLIPAKSGDCVLASTGANDPFGAGGLGLLGFGIVGTGLVLLAAAGLTARHRKEVEAN
jgi:hypothetical protein